MDAPLYERLKNHAAEKRVSFAMPGHKGRTDFSALAGFDTTELPRTADLHAESGGVSKANTLLSNVYKSERSFILSGGSTTAIHAMIAAAVSPGGTILVTPDCHMSVINICAVMGINLRVADVDFDSEFTISRGVKSILKYLNNYPDIRAVLITSPTYYGMCSDIKRIAEECHMHGKPLLVDEAHGAHFIASDRLPDSSSLYADIVCHSAHKTLNALTGAAYLHVNGGLIPPERVRRFINIFESSSPSYVIAASADIARAELANGDWDDTINLCEQFKNRITKLDIAALDNDDPTRVVLNFKKFDTTGYEIEKVLSEKHGIDIEMADMTNIVLIVTPKNTAEDFERLYSALAEITNSMTCCKTVDSEFVQPVPRGGIIRPQSAMFSEGGEVEISNASGLISRATVTAYPPGTPVIFAGEVITDAHISAVCKLQSAGAKITGMNKNMIDTVKI